MKLTPMADRVLLKPTEAEETTASGIILSTANKEKPVISEVVAVGPGDKGRRQGCGWQVHRDGNQAGRQGLHHCEAVRHSGNCGIIWRFLHYG